MGIDLDAELVRVAKNWVELLESPEKCAKGPKNEAGKRTVNVPAHVLLLLRQQAADFACPEIFCVGRDGKRMRGNTIYQAFVRARNLVGFEIALHDLRHEGRSLTALTGSTLVDLKNWLGHASSAAAQCYMHAVEGLDLKVAIALSNLALDGMQPSCRGLVEASLSHASTHGVESTVEARSVTRCSTCSMAARPTCGNG